MSCAKAEISGNGSRKCVSCKGGESSGLKVYSAEELQQELLAIPLWAASENGDHIVRSFVAKDFQTAMAFLNEVAKVAEEKGHHPDLHLTQYRKVEVRLHTFSMGGVTQNDIEEAKLFDRIPVAYSPRWLQEHPDVKAITTSS